MRDTLFASVYARERHSQSDEFHKYVAAIRQGLCDGGMLTNVNEITSSLQKDSFTRGKTS